MGYAALRGSNPRLIYFSVTAFGPDGPYRERPGFDPLSRRMGGRHGPPGLRRPAAVRAHAVTDYYAAALACQAVLAALFARERTGTGPARADLAPAGGARAPVRQHRGLSRAGDPVYRDTPTYRLYQAGDGEWFFLACGNQSFWVKLCTAMGRPSCADDPRFASWLGAAG